MQQKWSKLALSLGLIASSVVFNHAQAQSLVGINSINQVGVFEPDNVAGATFTNISGLGAGESFIGIDLRPSNNTIYGISSANKLYTLDAYSGLATFAFDLSSSIIASGVGYGVDFNPVADRGTGASFRVVGSNGSNVAVNASTGVVAIQTSVAAGFSGVGYSNSDPTQTVAPANTQLYYIDSTNDTLSVATTGFANPSISLVGAIGIDILKANGFELFSNNQAFAAINIDDGTVDSKLLSIDLNNGTGTLLGSFNGTINGLTSAPSAVPVPAALPLMASALGLFGISRRNRAKK